MTFVPAPRAAAAAFRAAAAGLLAAALLPATACGIPRSSLPFEDRRTTTSAAASALTLRALSPAAKGGVLTPKNDTAWFSLNDSRGQPLALNDGALELWVSVEGGAADLSAAPVTPSDLDASFRLVRDPSPRPLSVVTGVRGKVSIRVAGSSLAGIALSAPPLAGDTRVKILSVSAENPETGWSYGPGDPWFGFETSGGSYPWESPGRFESASFAVTVPPRSSVRFGFDPSLAEPGTPEKQNRILFSAGSRIVGWRVSPILQTAWLPSFLLSPSGVLPRTLKPLEFTGSLRSMRVFPSLAVPCADAANPRSPVTADPHAVIEWPQDRWRKADFEVFSWDLFPSVLIFDTADYGVQARLFNRLAFFVEKTGYRGRLLSDAELSGLHGYNAHDYRAESLAEFFETARKEEFRLGSEELELRDILLAEGILVLRGESIEAGAGAVVSISRESAEYLRYLFMAHEGYHGIYFTRPEFREAVAGAYRETDPRALGFLRGYFTVVDTLGYDVNDSYLMENEFMAYLMQQPLAKTAPYFTGVINERYLRYGGPEEYSDHVMSTGASDFEVAAAKLNGFVFSRWGLSGGRVGSWFFYD